MKAVLGNEFVENDIASNVHKFLFQYYDDLIAYVRDSDIDKLETRLTNLIENEKITRNTHLHC
ncbi:MAG: hypothetical protein Tsb005_20580 [Gammaproteobacteria bacterium]